MSNIDWAAAYQQVQENKNKGMGLQTGLENFTKGIVGAGKALFKGGEAVGQGIRNAAGGGNKNKDKDKETAEQRAARRAKVGLSGNAGTERAKASQAAAQPKIDAANQARKDNKAAGKTSSNLPSNYKETEAKEFEKADKFRKGAGTSSLPASVQREVKKAAAPTPKPQPKPLDTSKVTSPTPNFNRSAKPSVTPKPSGGGMKRRPTGRSEMRAANIAKTQRRSRPATVKPMASSSRLDSATSGVGKFSEEFELFYESRQKRAMEKMKARMQRTGQSVPSTPKEKLQRAGKHAKDLVTGNVGRAAVDTAKKAASTVKKQVTGQKVDNQVNKSPKQETPKPAKKRGFADLRGSATPGSDKPAAAKPTPKPEPKAAPAQRSRPQPTAAGKGGSSLPARRRSAPARSSSPAPKAQPAPKKDPINRPKFDTSKVGSGSSNFKRSDRIDRATSNVGKWNEAFELWQEQVAVQKMHGYGDGKDGRNKVTPPKTGGGRTGLQHFSGGWDGSTRTKGAHRLSNLGR